MLHFKGNYHSIKAVAWILFFILSFRLISFCEEEKAHARSYPQVKTMPVSNITPNGATFNGDIYSLGMEPIIEHGFVWGESKSPDLTSERILLGATGESGDYSANIITALAKDAEYTVKSFVKTAEHVVYGAPVTFISLGSGAPAITGFRPDSASWLDTLIISGKNFSKKAAENIIKLNETQCNVLEVSDTSIKVQVSKDLPDIESVISVELKGNKSTFIQDTFRLIAPRVTGIIPSEAYWGDELSISGMNFEAKNLISNISAKIGNYPAVITSRSNTNISLIVPNEINSINNNIKLTFNKLELNLTPGLTLAKPFINQISPKEGTWNSIITLKGKFHPAKDRNNITIGGFSPEIISNSRDSIRVYAPVYLTEHNNMIVNNVLPYTVTAKDTFKLLPPEIDTIGPLSGSSGTMVYITGKYLRSIVNLASVKFGETESSIRDNSEEMIVCYTPPMAINGPVDVTVTVGHQSVTYKYQFVVQNPVVTGVTPSTGTFDDQITIQGSNLILDGEIPSVLFGSYERSVYGPVVSATSTSITATVPRYMDSIPGNIGLMYFNKQLFIKSSASFVLAPPVITSVSPSTLIPGQTITISGNNFNPEANRNQVFWGSIPFTVSSASKSEIIVTVPDYLPRGSAAIGIQVGGYTRSYPNLLNYNNSAWSIVPVPSSYEWTALREIDANGISFATGGLGYIMDYAGKMSSFNPSSQTFADVSLFPDLSGIPSLTKTSINDTVLLFAGSSGFHRYDVLSSKWITVGSLPTTIRPGAYEFYVNGKLYFGGNTEVWTRYLWEYNPTSKIWTEKTVTTFQFNPYAVGSFVYNNKGYVLFLDNVLASYDPQTNSWTNMSPCPAPANIYGRITFTIDNMFYAGLGPGQSDIYRYDPSNDTWTQITTMPGLGRYNAVSFVLNGKAYIGFGFTTPGNNVTIKMNDFYEYNPNYPAK